MFGFCLRAVKYLAGTFVGTRNVNLELSWEREFNWEIAERMRNRPSLRTRNVNLELSCSQEFNWEIAEEEKNRAATNRLCWLFGVSR